MTNEQWQDFTTEAADWFDAMRTQSGMQAQCEQIAESLDRIGYDNDTEAMADYFEGVSAWEDRVDANGEYESQLIYLAWGNPYITFDTATGKVAGTFAGTFGSYRCVGAFVGSVARHNLNEFFRELHDC